MCIARTSVLPALLLGFVCAPAQEQADEQLLQHAIALHQAGDIEGAIRDYRGYLKRQPAAVQVRSNLGAALARAGRYEEAITEYNQALTVEPRNPPVLLNLALAYYKTNRVAEAARRLEEVSSLVSPDRQVTLLRASCYIRLGENGKAVALLSPLEAKNSGDLTFNYLLGTALIRDKQADCGARVIDRILSQGDSAEARLLLGTTKLFALDYPAALPDLKKAIELNPKLPEAHSYYGQALLATGDGDGAAAAFRRELELNPTDFLANLEMGVLKKRDREYKESRLYFERALASRPGDPGVRYQLATLDLADGQTDSARRQLESLVKESPQFLEAHVSLATVYYRLKRKDDGDRERTLVQRLTAEKQARQPGVDLK